MMVTTNLIPEMAVVFSVSPVAIRETSLIHVRRGC